MITISNSKCKAVSEYATGIKLSVADLLTTQTVQLDNIRRELSSEAGLRDMLDEFEIELNSTVHDRVLEIDGPIDNDTFRSLLVNASDKVTRMYKTEDFTVFMYLGDNYKDTAAEYNQITELLASGRLVAVECAELEFSMENGIWEIKFLVVIGNESPGFKTHEDNFNQLNSTIKDLTELTLVSDYISKATDLSKYPDTLGEAITTVNLKMSAVHKFNALVEKYLPLAVKSK